VNLNNINNLIPEGVSAGIYKITAPDGHYYIGSSVDLRKRIRNHFNDLKNNRHHTPIFQNKYNSHPDWVWVIELLVQVVLVDDWLLPIEQELLNIHFGTTYCMNCNPVASKPPSAWGKVCTLQTRTKISAALRGRIYSPETRAKMSAAQKGTFKPWITTAFKGRIPWNKGISPTVESRTKMSVAKKGKPNTALAGRGVKYRFYHKVYGLHLSTVCELEKVYTELNNPNLYKLVKGKTKQYKGWSVLTHTDNLSIVSEAQA
jgi:group I intron endonuclease